MSTKWTILGLAVALAGCGGSTTEPRAVKSTVAEVNVVPSTVSLSMGQTSQLSVLVYDKAGNPVTATPTWTSSDSRIASVSSSGQVTAAGVGTTAITAMVGGMPGIA